MTKDRTVFAISGTDAKSFLQDLVSNDVTKASGALVYAALLSPQGKYLFDFFLFEIDGVLHLDVKTDRAAALQMRLTIYKLRADVTIVETSFSVARGLNDMPVGAFADPRHDALGWRFYGENAVDEVHDWDAIRVAHCIPETGIELIADDTYLLEAGFERLNGVDFRKGCYVGQEVTARMKHKTELRKGLATVSVQGNAPVGTEITAGGKSVGTLYTQANGVGIAYLRFDRATANMQAGDAAVSFDK